MNNHKNIKIMVATHKLYEMPSDEMYLPVHVGAEGKFDEQGNPVDFGYIKDNTGDNISLKNYSFGTQTALYWGWKNLDVDYLGLIHYRRWFLNNKRDKDILSHEELTCLLEKYRVIAPQKRHYYIETIFSHYVITLNGGEQQLRHTRKIIEEISPEYLSAYDSFMKKRSGYFFNLMILEKQLMNEYCEWLFKILFELENRVDVFGYSDFDKRYIGRISELLFNVWLIHQMEIGALTKKDIKELPFYESVNWSKKILTFLMVKLTGKTYKESF